MFANFELLLCFVSQSLHYAFLMLNSKPKHQPLYLGAWCKPKFFFRFVFPLGARGVCGGGVQHVGFCNRLPPVEPELQLSSLSEIYDYFQNRRKQEEVENRSE